MRTTHDKSANVAYIYIKDHIKKDEVVATLECNNDLPVLFDLDAAGHLIGIEILDAKQLLPPEILD